MYLTQELQQHIFSTFATSSAFNCEMYFNHAPEDIQYPLITFNFVGGNNTMAMDDHDYDRKRVQFTIYTNEQQYSDGLSISNNLENLYHRKGPIVLNNDVTMICSKTIGSLIQFFDKDEKIWQFIQDYQFLTGK